jgi:hypothetical protein
MEISQKHKVKIDQIMQEMNCKKDFECYKTGLKNLPKVKRRGKLIECLEENPTCEFAMPFGYGLLCQCPLNNYIQQNLIP